MVSDVTYQELVDGLVHKRLHQTTSWPALLTALPGVYPAIVYEAALRLGLLDMVLHAGQFTANAETTTTVARLWEDRLLSTPHLLDASWWFADSALDSLFRRICQYSVDGERVLLLGTPTLFQAARERAVERKFTLVDRDAFSSPSSVSDHTIQADIVLKQQDLLDPPAVIVVDPPWYVAETRSFLWMARRNSRLGTRILLSTPPIGTRPGIEKEWGELLVWCAQIGLQLDEYLHAELAYITPPFEHNALTAAGVPECPLNWRRGDLAVFACVHDDSCPAPRVPSISLEAWHDVSIGRVRVRIRPGDTSRWANPVLKECVKGNVLPSVSRRNSFIESVRIWTSGNRVFTSENVTAIRWIAEALAAKESPAALVAEHMGTAIDDSWISQVEMAARQIEEVVSVEENELSDWKRRLNEQLVEFAS